MRFFRFLSVVLLCFAPQAFAQVRSGCGINMSCTASTFYATNPSKGLVVQKNASICLSGSSCGVAFFSDGINVTQTSGTLYVGGGIGSHLVQSDSSSAVEIRGNIPDGASAVGVILNNAQTLSTSGSKIVSVRNNGVEKASIDNGGFLIVNGANMNGGNIYGSPGIFGAYTYRSDIADGATATAFTFWTSNAFATAGAKLASFQNGTTEKVAFDYQGNITAQGVVRANGATTGGLFSGSCTMATSTTCTIANVPASAKCVCSPQTLGSVYTTGCSLTTNTLTVNASASNSETWNAVCL